MTNTLPADLTLRAPTMSDLEAVVQLIIACDIADFGDQDYTADDLLTEWRRPHFDLATDARVVLTSQGEIIGYTDVCEEGTGLSINPLLCIHPDYRGLGIERYLLHLSEERGRQYSADTNAKVRRVFRTVAITEARHQLLKEEGYMPIKVDWHMEIKLDEAPQAPQWPDSFTVRTFIVGQDDRIVHRLIQEAFSELAHRSYVPFEEWEQRMVKRDNFDPTLAFVVEHGQEVIAAMMGYNYPNEGWIRQFAVARPWRRQGLGTQLLHHAFSEFYQRGKRKAGLVVDSENPTGAPQFYIHAGMYVAQHFDTYEKDF